MMMVMSRHITPTKRVRMAGVRAEHMVEFAFHKDTDNLGNESGVVSLGTLLDCNKPSCLPIKEMVWVAIPSVSTGRGAKEISIIVACFTMCPLFPVSP